MFFNFDGFGFQIAAIFALDHANGGFHVNPRPFAALSFRVHGKGDFVFENGAHFAANTGDISFLPAGMAYDVYYSNSKIIVIHLDDCNYATPENITVQNPEYFLRLFENLLLRWTNQHKINAAKADVYSVLAAMERDAEANISKDVKTCALYIQENFSSPTVKIADLCRRFHMSESNLYRNFCSCYGMSPKQYLLHLRLNCALELLLREDRNIQGVALACGFDDPKYFSRAFKKHYGKSPIAFKKDL